LVIDKEALQMCSLLMSDLEREILKEREEGYCANRHELLAV